MPFAPKPTCSSCKASSSTVWRRATGGHILCNSCALKQLDGVDFRDSGVAGDNGNGYGNDGSGRGKDAGSASHYAGPLRKSARLKPSKYKFQAAAKPLATKGKSRRVVFKKNPIKAATSVATVVTSEFVFHEGTYWQRGDIVSVMDDDGGIYYAQIRGFLQDQYSEKSVVITWLLPTTGSPRDRFDPSTYVIGPEEELPRSIDYFEFIMHAPSEFFKSTTSPYPTQQTQPELGYIWTSLGPEIAPVPTREEIYGLRDPESERTAVEAKGRGKEDRRRRREPKLEKREKRNGTTTPRERTRGRGKEREQPVTAK